MRTAFRGRARPVFKEPFPILYVSNMERSIRFYCDLLGFHEAYRWPAEGPLEFAYLHMGNAGIGLSPESVAESLHGRLVCRDQAAKFELCLYTEDVDQASEHLQAHGVQQLRPAATMPWGERMAYFMDPDGNPIHMTARVSG